MNTYLEKKILFHFQRTDCFLIEPDLQIQSKLQIQSRRKRLLMKNKNFM